MTDAMQRVVDIGPCESMDDEYLYWLCESTMRGYVEEIWGNWNAQDVRRQLTSMAQEERFRSIVVDGQRVGAIMYENGPPALVLEQIFVEPARQRTGIGSLVMMKLQGLAAEKSGRIELAVLSSNPAKLCLP